MGKIEEFEQVYIEYPDTYFLEEEELNKRQRLSLEELQQKLEETSSLHL